MDHLLFINIVYNSYLRSIQVIRYIIIPSLICLIAIFTVIKQTPIFLINGLKPQAAAQALNQIGRLNKKVDHLVTVQQIVKFKQNQQALHPSQNLLTFLDLFKNKNVRVISICLCLISYVIYMLYYGPLMLMESFGMNVYINCLAMAVSQLITFIPAYFLIEKMSRKWVSIGMFVGALLCSFILIFVHRTNCTACFTSYLQVGLIFLFRFFTSLQFAIFLIYINQLYPAQIRGLGVGLSSAFGTLGSSSAPIIIGQLKKTSFPIPILFCISALISIILSLFLPQTKGKQMKQFIKEFDQESQRAAAKQRNIELATENTIFLSLSSERSTTQPLI